MIPQSVAGEATQTHWRLALMFDAPGGDLQRLEQELKQSRAAIQAAVGSCGLRMGVADRSPTIVGSAEVQLSVAGWRRVDGVVEITLVNEFIDEVPKIAAALRPILGGFAQRASVEVVAGPTFSMVPVRPGTAFLSLAFRRFPGTTSRDFSTWWREQHGPLAIPALGAGLLAYDQVHVDHKVSQAAARAFDTPFVEYDAYDNLTWADHQSFVHSCSQDPEGMENLGHDEIGRIDGDSRRHSLMREVI